MLDHANPPLVSPFVENASASITIAGVGTVGFVKPTGIFYNTDVWVISFGENNTVVDVSFFNSFNTLPDIDLKTSIGPLTGDAGFGETGFPPFQTTGGALTLNGRFTEGTFQAILGTTPLPAALPLFASGLGVRGFAWLRRRRTSPVK